MIVRPEDDRDAAPTNHALLLITRAAAHWRGACSNLIDHRVVRALRQHSLAANAVEHEPIRLVAGHANDERLEARQIHLHQLVDAGAADLVLVRGLTGDRLLTTAATVMI